MSDTDRLQDKRVKAHHMLPVIDSDLMPDSAVADVTVLPAAIQPFKSVPREPAPHLVAENQISLAYFSVAVLLSSLPHSEVPKQVLGNVRFERNLHEGMKDFRGLWEVQIGPGNVDQPELAELTQQGEVAVQVTDEIREPRSPLMDIGECHHRRGRSQAHGELVDEIPNGWYGSFPAQIEVGGKKLLANTQSFTEVLELFRLSFQVLIPLVQENEIEHGNAALDEVELMLTAVAEALLFDLAIEPAREQVMHDTAFRKAFRTSVPSALELAPESGRTLAPMSARKAKELVCGEVTGMGCNEVEKPCLWLGVAKCLERVEMCGCDVHSESSQCIVFSEMRVICLMAHVERG